MSTYNREFAQQYYKQNKEKITARNKIWQQQNREKMKDYQKKYRQSDKYQIDFANKIFKHYLLKRVKKAALSRNLEFDIDITDIIIPEKCPYLKCDLTTFYGRGFVETNASIDRIDSTKGYIKGNIQMISLQANRMKNNASVDQLILFARSVLEHHVVS